MKMRHWSPAHVKFPSPITHFHILHHQAVSKGKFSTSTVIHVDYSRSDIAVIQTLERQNELVRAEGAIEFISWNNWSVQKSEKL